MATFNFKELFSNQFRKDGTLKARNTIENYMRCLHNKYTNIYEFEEKTYFGHTKSFYNHNVGKFQNFLKQLGIEYTIENDAPRGGRSGNHIVIVDKKLAEEVYNQFSAEY